MLYDMLASAVMNINYTQLYQKSFRVMFRFLSLTIYIWANFLSRLGLPEPGWQLESNDGLHSLVTHSCYTPLIPSPGSRSLATEFGGEWGQGIKISSRKCNLTSPILICLFTMHLVLGILLSIFRRKKTNKVQCVLGPNLTVFEDK